MRPYPFEPSRPYEGEPLYAPSPLPPDEGQPSDDELKDNDRDNDRRAIIIDPNEDEENDKKIENGKDNKNKKGPIFIDMK